jgi:hypothetical protein
MISSFITKKIIQNIMTKDCRVKGNLLIDDLWIVIGMISNRDFDTIAKYDIDIICLIFMNQAMSR